SGWGMCFAPEEPKQHIEWRSILRMRFKAGALKPLHQVGLTIAECFGLGFAERQAEQGQALRLSRANAPIEFQTMRPPVAKKGWAEAMAAGRKEETAGSGRATGEAAPIAVLLTQAIDAQSSQQDIKGSGVLWMQFQPVAFKSLHLERVPLDLL